MSKNQTLLESFTAYCKQYPELRFWQALRSWAGVNYILTAKECCKTSCDVACFDEFGLSDTFYWEEKDK